MPQLDALYREVVLDHYKRPRGRAKVEHPNLCTSGFNPTCGDQVMLSLDVEGGRFRGVEAQCMGCSISVASTSMMAELLQGRSRDEGQLVIDAFRGMMHGHEPDRISTWATWKRSPAWRSFRCGSGAPCSPGRRCRMRSASSTRPARMPRRRKFSRSRSRHPTARRNHAHP
ncbi:MAG: SUF system NifU family Fe-S cluster assembly protein [Candidatus Eisenbacteria bacterium]